MNYLAFGAAFGTAK